MSLYRKLTPAEVLAMVAGAKSGVTHQPVEVTQTAGVTTSDSYTVTPETVGEFVTPGEAIVPEPSPSAQRRSKDRHKPTQAEYMRAYRARKKAEGGAGRGT